MRQESQKAPTRLKPSHELNHAWQACRDKAVYQLAARGVRVVSGRSEDSEAADSNGAGKSALVMSASWALTGRSDARLEVGDASSGGP